MEAAVIERLSRVNREFYTAFAADFSNARPVSRTNLQAIMPYLAGCVKLLDIGCGNGRLAGRLDQDSLRIDYTGIDVTPTLLDIARACAVRLQSVTAAFRLVDLMQPEWADQLHDRALFDAITALAVIHHIPAMAERTRVLRAMFELLRPGGVLILSNWQYDQTARLRRKIVPWSAIGLSEADVEPGDALLSWERGGYGYRYCHLLTTGEMETLAAASGFHVSTQFPGDAGLNLFSVLVRPLAAGNSL
jgi:tRNA (uracil-5-)-methyltransferase TRM9